MEAESAQVPQQQQQKEKKDEDQEEVTNGTDGVKQALIEVSKIILSKNNSCSSSTTISHPASPTHEFEFMSTLLIPTSSNYISTPTTCNTTHKRPKSWSSYDEIKNDLCPADDLFYHGHLLPLHQYDHDQYHDHIITPISSRTSTTSIISTDHGHHHHTCTHQLYSHHDNQISYPTSTIKSQAHDHHHHHQSPKTTTTTTTTTTIPTRPKAKSFSSFFSKKALLIGSRRRNMGLVSACKEVIERYVKPLLIKIKSSKKEGEGEDDDDERRLGINHRRWSRPVSATNSFSKQRSTFRPNHHSSSDHAGLVSSVGNYNYNGNVINGDNHEMMMMMSASSHESSMEDLHNAIQAAIAHCKNSIAAADLKEDI